ncbi:MULTISPECIES: putative holin [Acinetobacter]|uniref:putative holin n=1 Tax=Acinetobacter TaxID=469 RepID=UPI0015B4C7F8|nr:MULTISPECIES: putative holin [Acinetobacter]MBT0887570.1 hypothetical protein [Acinetobacter towneri]NWJ92976.1 hypothetical protein [Acinetobacter sp. Swhac1]
MAEPTSSTTVAITAGAGLISLLPFVNGDALFGAVIGAAFVSFYSQQGGYEKRIGAFLISTAIGYLFAPEVVKYSFIDSYSSGAFITALFAILVLNKVMAWANGATLSEIISAFSGKFIDVLNLFRNKKGGD